MYNITNGSNIHKGAKNSSWLGGGKQKILLSLFEKHRYTYSAETKIHYSCGIKIL